MTLNCNGLKVSVRRFVIDSSKHFHSIVYIKLVHAVIQELTLVPNVWFPSSDCEESGSASMQILLLQNCSSISAYNAEPE